MNNIKLMKLEGKTLTKTTCIIEVNITSSIDSYYHKVVRLITSEDLSRTPQMAFINDATSNGLYTFGFDNTQVSNNNGSGKTDFEKWEQGVFNDYSQLDTKQLDLIKKAIIFDPKTKEAELDVSIFQPDAHKEHKVIYYNKIEHNEVVKFHQKVEHDNQIVNKKNTIRISSDGQEYVADKMLMLKVNANTIAGTYDNATPSITENKDSNNNVVSKTWSIVVDGVGFIDEYNINKFIIKMIGKTNQLVKTTGVHNVNVSFGEKNKNLQYTMQPGDSSINRNQYIKTTGVHTDKVVDNDGSLIKMYHTYNEVGTFHVEGVLEFWLSKDKNTNAVIADRILTDTTMETTWYNNSRKQLDIFKTKNVFFDVNPENNDSKIQINITLPTALSDDVLVLVGKVPMGF